MPKRIVYFAGAGLTKSLEKPGVPIPLMYDFLQVMAGYARYQGEDIILTTLAELENATVFEATCPKLQKLAQSVVGRDRDTRQETRDAFSQAFRDRPSESVEDLLLRAFAVAAESTSQSDAGAESRRSSAQEAGLRFNYAINRVFSNWIGWEVNWCPLERFLQRQFTRFPLDGGDSNCHTFITFNYDLILDRAVHKAARDRFGHECWHPSKGYGFSIDYFVDEEPVPARNGAQSYPRAKSYPATPCINVEILKPHGSLNWLVPHQDSHKFAEYGLALKDRPVILPLTPNEGELRYWPSKNPYDSLIYERPDDPSHIGEHVGICILPPLPPAKQPALEFIKSTRCWEAAAVREADEFYILGWSMPKTDQDQFDLMKGAIAARRKPISRVVVVNRGAKPEYFDHIRETFAISGSNLEVHNAGFCEFAGRLEA